VCVGGEVQGGWSLNHLGEKNSSLTQPLVRDWFGEVKNGFSCQNAPGVRDTVERSLEIAKGGPIGGKEKKAGEFKSAMLKERENSWKVRVPVRFHHEKKKNEERRVEEVKRMRSHYR